MVKVDSHRPYNEFVGDRVIRRYPWPNHVDAEFLLRASEVGCAPPVMDQGPLAISMPRLTNFETWLSTADNEARRRVGASLAQVIHRLHAAGVCHRDLHVGNVVLEGARPYLIDFELAAWSDPSLRCYDFVGPNEAIDLPVAHRRVGLLDGVWWDSPTPFVRTLRAALGPVATIDGEVHAN
jgi:tRNA A-37 threonylcarbamoyl transferase component Bud32